MGPLPFEEAELAELTRFLGDRSLASVVGMLAAVVSVPEVLPSQLWLGELMKDIEFTTAEQAQRFADLIKRLNNHVATAFADGDPERICPSDGEPGDDDIDDDAAHGSAERDGYVDDTEPNAEFCTGYLSIIRAAGIDTESGSTLQLLGRIARGEEKAWSMTHDFNAVLGSLYVHWHPPLSRTIQRQSPKIGRNDPCHCGSGKKFKKCHGAPS